MVGLKLQMLTALLAMLALAVPANGAAFLQEFDALNAIDTALSFPGSISISADDVRRVAVDGPQELIDALDIKVTDKTLNLGLQSMTTVTIGNASYNISVPASSISELDKTGSGSLLVDGGISASGDAFNLMVSGSGSLFVDSAMLDRVQVMQSGSSTIKIDGSFSMADITMSGSGATYLAGVQKSVEVDLSGSGKVFIDAQGAGDLLDISGEATGSALVMYTSGTCDVSGIAARGDACRQVQSINVPASN